MNTIFTDIEVYYVVQEEAIQRERWATCRDNRTALSAASQAYDELFARWELSIGYTDTLAGFIAQYQKFIDTNPHNQQWHKKRLEGLMRELQESKYLYNAETVFAVDLNKGHTTFGGAMRIPHNPSVALIYGEVYDIDCIFPISELSEAKQNRAYQWIDAYREKFPKGNAVEVEKLYQKLCKLFNRTPRS